MKTIIGVLYAGVILFSGCSQSGTENANKDIPTNGSEELQLDPVDVSMDSVKPPETTNNTANFSLPSGGSEVSSGKLNPAHGEPGHRCDIPVGSPLNSPPGNVSTATPPVTATPVPPVAATPVKTAPGMNPPHGEPGHDCSIAVGQPLKK